MSNIPSIIKDAELSLEKLDGMIDAADYSKLKTAVEELGAAYRKRAYGFNLSELYTIAEWLKSKKISAEDLAEGLRNHSKGTLLGSMSTAGMKPGETISMTIENKVNETDISYTYKYLLDLVMTVRDPEEYDRVREELREMINRSVDEVYIIMSPGGGISLDIGSGKGTCYSDLEEAKKDLEATNKWSAPRGRGVYELVTLKARKKY